MCVLPTLSQAASQQKSFPFDVDVPSSLLTRSPLIHVLSSGLQEAFFRQISTAPPAWIRDNLQKMCPFGAKEAAMLKEEEHNCEDNLAHPPHFPCLLPHFSPYHDITSTCITTDTRSTPW